MKKYLALTLALLLVVSFVLLSAYLVCSLYVFDNYAGNATLNKNSNTIVASGEEAKILVLSDLQFANTVEMSWAFSAVKKLVKLTRPDIIVTTGDNLGNNVSLRYPQQLVRFMDSFCVPWGVVFGNHDYNTKCTIQQYCAVLEQSKYGLFVDNAIQNSHSNYFYTLQIGQNKCATLIFVDTHKNGLTEQHTNWYKDIVSTNANGNVLPSFVFMHIPPEQMITAAQQYKQNSSMGTGVIGEQVNAQSTNSGFFDLAVQLGSTKAIFFGHDHLNNAAIDFDGIKLCYSLKTGKTVEYDRNGVGGVVLTVDKQGNFSLQRHFL